MRTILSRALLAAGAVGLTACIVFAVKVGQSHLRAVGTDDFAGFSLSLLFPLYALVPLTLSLFIAAGLLDAPIWLLRWLGIGASPSRPFRTKAVAVLCLAGAAVAFLYVVIFVGGGLMGAARHYGYACRGLGVILLQNLVPSFPLLILGALLARAAWALNKWAPQVDTLRAKRYDVDV